MISATLTRSIWSARRKQHEVLAQATRKRDIPQIELTEAEWNLLRSSDAMAGDILENASNKQV